jgi:hypothetical protein
MMFRRKSRAPSPPAAGTQGVPAPSPRVAPVGREPEGFNPYDTGSTRRAEQPRLNDRPARTRAGDPYGTADTVVRRRSWDDALIDTWVEHE